MDVDYGGSTGYGREYRRRLDGQWGVVDVDDCVAAARFLVERGDVDPWRLAIEGGSAGGYTTLAALAFRDVFAAGISLFGIGDLALLETQPHKFESRYNHRLVGPYPEAAALYRERSPNYFMDRFSCPVLILQGLDDKVVPPAQAESIVAALAANGIPHAYLAFEGEGHGFRGAYAIRRTIEARLSFLGQVFGFVPDDQLEPLEVPGLDTWRRPPPPARRSASPRHRPRPDGAQPHRAGPRPVRRRRRPGVRRPLDRRRRTRSCSSSAASPSGWSPGVPSIVLDPSVVFLLLLPPILFGAGYSTPIRDFKANLRPIVLLAVGLVAVHDGRRRRRRPAPHPRAGGQRRRRLRAGGDRGAAGCGRGDGHLPAPRRAAPGRDDPRGREPDQRRDGADRLPVRGRRGHRRRPSRSPTAGTSFVFVGLGGIVVGVVVGFILTEGWRRTERPDAGDHDLAARPVRGLPAGRGPRPERGPRRGRGRADRRPARRAGPVAGRAADGPGGLGHRHFIINSLAFMLIGLQLPSILAHLDLPGPTADRLRAWRSA